LPVANGGTNVSTAPTNGQLLIGNGTGYTLGTISAGTNITVTNTAGGISIAATSVADGLGYGQTWQNVFSSRVSGTTYTNSTTKPIMVAITTYDINSNTTLLVSGIQVGASGGVNGQNNQLTAIVPVGATYVCTGGITNWAELR
jgi:hypothetical protein